MNHISISLKNIIPLLLALVIFNLNTVQATTNSDDYSENTYSTNQDNSLYPELNTTTTSSKNTSSIFKIGKIFFTTIIILALIIFIYGNFIQSSSPKQKKTLSAKELTEKEIKKIATNLDSYEIKTTTFTLYKELQTALVKRKPQLLIPILTPSLIPTYEEEIKKLKENHHKLVATDITLKEAKIMSITKDNDDNLNINLYLHTSQYDYLIDKNKKVIRGTPDEHYQIEYNINIQKQKDDYKISSLTCTGKWISK